MINPVLKVYCKFLESVLLLNVTYINNMINGNVQHDWDVVIQLLLHTIRELKLITGVQHTAQAANQMITEDLQYVTMRKC